MNTIGYFEIQASEPEKAVEFYKNIFGWNFIELSGLPIKYWRIETDSIAGGLLEHPMKTPPMEYGTNAYTCSIQVENFDSTAETILNDGGQIAMAKFEIPGRCWQGYFINLDNKCFRNFRGNRINRNTDKGEKYNGKNKSIFTFFRQFGRGF